MFELNFSVHASADPDVHKVVARVSSNGSKSHAHVNVQLIRLNQQHVVIKNHGTMTVARVNANLVSHKKKIFVHL